MFLEDHKTRIFGLFIASFYQSIGQTICFLQSEDNTETLSSMVNSTKVTCIPFGISSFPFEFLTQEQRVEGGLVLHILIIVYLCFMIGTVCHSYFVPSIQLISNRLKLRPDIAGATFMAIGTSAPELFSSITGSFITEDDIGVGTVIGSAVFNIVGITGFVGLFLWNEILDMEWYPIARDCTVYSIAVSILIWILSDNEVKWWQSVILLCISIVYIVIICFNKKIENWSKVMVKSKMKCCCWKKVESYPLMKQNTVVVNVINNLKPTQELWQQKSFSDELTATKANGHHTHLTITVAAKESFSKDEDNQDSGLFSPSSSNILHMSWWLLMLPANILFFLTLPNQKRNRKLYPLTFVVSVIWIGFLSYLAVWMVTVISFTLGISDSVSGATILAIGTSAPEVISSIIVAKTGLGNMAVSSLIGSNIFDISFCLGAPWLIKCIISKRHSIVVFSSALMYTTATLLLTIILYIAVFCLSRWKLNRTVGISFILVYTIFAVLVCLYELNIFGEINKPNCES